MGFPGELLRQLDRSWRAVDSRASIPPDGLFGLLARLAGPGAPTRRADWLCILGDLAADRDDLDEAIARYRVAVGQDCAAAKERLAYQLSIRGSRQLDRGDVDDAHACFYTAAWLVDDPEYEMAYAATGLLARDGSARTHLGRLSRLRAEDFPPGLLAFWIGIGRLMIGERDGATAALTDASRAGGELARVCATLLTFLTDDRAQVVATVRELLRDKDSALDRCPVAPECLVDGTARHAPDLLADLLAALPATTRLGDATVVVAARVLLSQAIALSAAGSTGTATERLDLCHRMLTV